MERALYLPGAAFLFGIVCAVGFGAGAPFVGLVLVIAVASVIVLMHTSRRVAIVISITVLACVLGVARGNFLPSVHEDALDHMVGKEVSITGTIVEDPDRRDTTTRIVVDVATISSGTAKTVPLTSPARVLVSTFPHVPFSYGDTVSATGTLRYPETFDTGSGRVFEYPGYLEMQHIGYQMSRASVDVTQHAGHSLKGALFSVKQWFVTGLHRSLEEPAAGLSAGIMVGDKHSLGDSLTQAFRTSGLIHVVVLSGFHITIVGAVLLALFAFLPPTARLSGSFLGIVLFIIMTGSSTTAIRAGVMGSIALLARGVHRQYDALRALLVATVGMVVWQPLVLFYDPGFHMSVAATAGIILLTPRIIAWLPQVFPKMLRELLGTTIGAQLMVAPLIAYYMGTVSLVALVANILVLPVVPFAMLLSLAAGVLGAIVPISLAPLVGFPAFVVLEYMVQAATFASSVPFAAIAVPAIPAWTIIALYAAGGVWLVESRPVPEQK